MEGKSFVEDQIKEEDAAIAASLAAAEAANNTKSVFLRTAVKAVKTDTRRSMIANKFLQNLNYGAIAMESYPPADIPIEKQTQFRLGVANGDLETKESGDIAVFAVRIPAGTRTALVEEAIAKLVGSHENVVSKSYFGTQSQDSRTKIGEIVYGICGLATDSECSNAATNPPYYEFMGQAREIVKTEMNAID